MEGPSLSASSDVGTREAKSVMGGPLLLIPWSPRSHKTQVLDSYVYEDKDDLFAREPFVAQFTFPSKGRKGRRVALLCGSGQGGLAGSLRAWLLAEAGWGMPGAGGSLILGPCSPSQPGAGPTAHHSEGRGEGAECPVRRVSGRLPALAEQGRAGQIAQEGQGHDGWVAGPDCCPPAQDMILLGDFNADCASLNKKRLAELALRTEAGFRWVIADGEDTTVRASTHCAYDRIVLHGERCQSLLSSAAAFNFPRSFRLNEEEVKGRGRDRLTAKSPRPTLRH